MALTAALAVAGWIEIGAAAPVPLGAGWLAGKPDPYPNEALAYCERGLAAAREQAARRPYDPCAHLRVASLETRRGSLLALAAYERARRPHCMDDDLEYPVWRAHFLRTDPDGSLTRAERAARAALRAERDPRAEPLPVEARREAFLLLAAARKGLGDPLGEARALAAAVRYEPHQAELWLRLADAYARARRFSRAEAAMARALQAAP